jgi:hypothetical protein
MSDLPGSIGSNHLGVWFPVVPAALFFIYQFMQAGWPAVKHDILVGTVITIVSYGLLFLYCVARNVYREHVALVRQSAKLKMELDYIRDQPRWIGYESEQAWRAAIDEQNRLVNLGHWADGVCSSLQIDAFKFAKEASIFLGAAMMSFPGSLDPRASSIDEIYARSDEKIAWRKKTESLYQLQFGERENKLLLGFRAAGIGLDASVFPPRGPHLEEDLPRNIAYIVVMAHEIDQIKLAVR